jgi:hypothetical protein
MKCFDYLYLKQANQGRKEIEGRDSQNISLTPLH